MPRFRIGLRTVKTVLAVILSMFAASLLGELSIFPALSAFAVMSRTFQEGLQECRNQAVGIFIGGIIGCTTALLIPSPPIWLMGLGVMVIILLCTSLHVSYSCGLSVAIFIVSCMTAQDQVVLKTLTRLFHTSIGLIIGLTINYLIVPYDNSPKIYELFQQLVDSLPGYLDQSVVSCLFPDVTPLNTTIDQLHYELSIYHHQRFRHKQHQRDAYVYMCGCMQLAERIQHELLCLCSMDTIGIPEEAQLLQLQKLGLEIPEYGMLFRHSTVEDDIVTNFHLKKLLDARAFLNDMIENRKP